LVKEPKKSGGESKVEKTAKVKKEVSEGKDTLKEKDTSKDIKPVSTAPAPKSFARRDHIRKNEIEVQQRWDSQGIYEAKAKPGVPKYFVTFPYPYMNGRLHLGHAFSLTKAEFTARFKKLQGMNVLWPFAFHCTGMPIQAAANKLKDEVNTFGNPPVFPSDDEVEAVEEEDKSFEATLAAKSKGYYCEVTIKMINDVM
jgi:leucyl-tRNA synthetase